MVFGNRCCCGADPDNCCNGGDIVLNLDGIVLIDGASAEAAGCTSDVMAEMNAVLASDIVLSHNGSCIWAISYRPPSRVNDSDRLEIIVTLTSITLRYVIPFSGSPQISRTGVWDCETWTPDDVWQESSNTADNCFIWSGFETASETIESA